MTDEVRKKKTSWGRFPFAEVIRRIWKFFGWRLIFGLIAAIFALVFFIWLADEVFEGETKIFDETIRRTINAQAAPWLTNLMRFFSLVGSPLVLTILGAVIVAIFLFIKWKRALVLFLLTMAGELFLDLSLKTLYARVRPEPFFDYPLPSSYSFPSGHALGSVCFFGILAWLVTARIENHITRKVIWTAALILIACIGFSRIYLGVHYPSDVIAGFTAAFIWVFSISFADSWLKKSASAKTVPE